MYTKMTRKSNSIEKVNRIMGQFITDFFFRKSLSKDFFGYVAF